MSLATFVLLAVAAVVVVVFLVLLTRRQERERTEALRRFAETTGLSFQPKAEIDSVRSIGDVQLFARGHSKRVTNLMIGRVDDQDVAIFDYRYTTGSGKHQSHHSQTVVLLPAAKRSLPDLQMAPENPLLRIAEVFGYQDIDIEASPEFSRRYIVKGSDEAAIRQALYPEATAFFADHGGWTVEVQSGNVSIYRADSRPKPEQIPAFVADACAAARTL